MVERVEVTDGELRRLIQALTTRDVQMLRLWIDGGLKYKINGGCWSPPIGDLRTNEY